MQEDLYCYSPFYMAEVSSLGDVYPCCPRYINSYSFGNILDSEFEEIWYSKEADTFRQNILNGDYSLCNLDRCVFNIKKSKREIFGSDNVSKYPPVKYLRLAYDNTCNVACITCRDNILVDKKEKLEKIYNKLLSVFPTLDTIQLNTTGDVFCGKHGRDLISYITSNYPHIKFIIDTNGILLSSNLYNKLNLKNKIELLNISIPSLNEKTYNKIVKFGKFNKLKSNLDFLINEKNLGHIKELTIIMVVHKLNYKEMPFMARYAAANNIKIFFSLYQPWEHTTLAKSYDKLAVFLPAHKEHKNFLRVISNKALDSDCCSLEDGIKKLISSYKRTKLDDIKDFFSEKINL